MSTRSGLHGDDPFRRSVGHRPEPARPPLLALPPAPPDPEPEPEVEIKVVEPPALPGSDQADDIEDAEIVDEPPHLVERRSPQERLAAADLEPGEVSASRSDAELALIEGAVNFGEQSGWSRPRTQNLVRMLNNAFDILC